MVEKIENLLSKFDIKANDINIYFEAFTHASYHNEHPNSKDYDRLEFLGDSILDMIVADLVYCEYPQCNSGLLSKMRSFLVSGTTLTKLSEEVFGLSELVRYSKGEKDNTRFHKHIDEDVFEAFIGAIYIDQGYKKVRKIVKDIFTPFLKEAYESISSMDAKGRLQTLVKDSIDYVKISESNLNTDDVSYVVEARYGGTVLGIGKGHNLKEAQTNAALDALSKKVGN